MIPAYLEDAARSDPNGEMSWPRAVAADVIKALADSGHVILGLDLRTYGEDGSITEIAWFDNGSSKSVEASREDALHALVTADADADLPHEWVLVTWD